MVGYSLSENKNVEMFCTDESGNVKWQKHNEKYVRIESTIELIGETIVGVGSISSGDEGSKLRIVKIDNTGNTLSEREYGMGRYTYSAGTGIEIFDLDKLIISAKSSGFGDVISNFWAWLLETDLNGDTLWTRIINNTGTNIIAGEYNSLGKLEDGQYFAAGRFVDLTKVYNSDFWITKFKIDTTINGIDFDGEVEAAESYALRQNYPNPFNPETTIEYYIAKPGKTSITIYNVLGEIIELFDEGFQNIGNNHIIFNGGTYPSGVYFYKIKSGDFSNIKSMVLLK